MSESATTAEQRPAERRDRSHYLYMAVIIAVIAGIAVGLLAPDVGKALKPLGTGFVNLIKMMISPVIFCTIVLGVGSIRQAAKVGKVRRIGAAVLHRRVDLALFVGLIVGNILQPGAGLQINGAQAPGSEAASTTEFLIGIIPTTLISPLVGDMVLQTLFVALLIGFGVQSLGRSARRSFVASSTSSDWCSGSSR